MAHSVTLALGIYGVVNVSAAIVEPLIAASIVYVCLENIYSSQLSRWRPFIIFAFGLLHGLGFASVLGEIGLGAGSFVTGLIAFNVGVELGQLLALAAILIVMGIWRHSAGFPRQAFAANVLLMIAGLVLMGYQLTGFWVA